MISYRYNAKPIEKKQKLVHRAPSKGAELLRLIENYKRNNFNMSDRMFGFLSLGDHGFLVRLRAGTNPRQSTIDRVMDFINGDNNGKETKV